LAELYNLPREALREDPADTREPKVFLIKVEGIIEPVLTTFVSRQIHRAVAAGATHLIFEIDSPGGRLAEAYDLASQIADLDPEQVRTIAYVPEEAISAAAIIALGADEIYMHPSALIGDAGPMTHDGEQFERVPEKVLSLVRQMLKDLAVRKNRPPALVMAMADKDLVVYEVTHRESGRTWYMTEQEIHESNGEWIKGRPVPESRKNLLLTLNGRRAHELKLAEAPVEDFATLKQRLGIPEQVKIRVVGRTWVDELVFYLNTPAALLILFTLGVLLIFLDLHLMTGFLGILSALCFGVIFWSRFLGGTAGWLEVVLFVLGMACIVLEIFVMPGFGVFGVSGGLLVFAALIMASQTFSGIEPGSDFRILARTIGTLGASVFCVLVIGFLLSRYLPHMPIFNRMILSPPGLTDADEAGGPRLRPQLVGGRHALLGEQGVAISMLRPAGKAQIAGEYLDVVSDGTYIPQGAAIEVVEVAGNRIIVREV
ncbi:MAG: NfeD family protein, partial [Planctomycetaceae bacterium]